MKNITERILVLLLLVCSISCQKSKVVNYQLVIVNASLFDAHTKQTEPNRTIFLQNGIIKKISPTEDLDYTYKNSIDAKERLVTPAFIDVHNHLNFIFGDTTLITNPDDFEQARRTLTEEYFPFGITVVRSAGGRASHLPMEQSWMKSHPDYVDYFPTGGALVSLDTKFYNHQFVQDSNQVKAIIQKNYQLGFRHTKVYSLIGENELKAAINTAAALDMNIFGHIENSMISIEIACSLGLKNFEHAKTLFLEVSRQGGAKARDLSSLPPDDMENWRYREYELFNLIGSCDSSLMELIQLLKKSNASVTPTLHLYAHPLGLTDPKINMGIKQEDSLNWEEEKFSRAKLGYYELASTVFMMYEKGIVLNTGSDTCEPGKTILSEMLLLNDLGIPMEDVLLCATLNSANSMQIEERYGSIEVDKKAHLIIFNESPLINPSNLLGEKIIIKDGVVWDQQK